MRRITPLLLIGMLVLAGCSSTRSTEQFSCLSEQREVEGCYQVYEPVCATVNIQCIRAPCYPVNQTFSNACEACRNPLIEVYVEGECSAIS